MRKEQGLVYPWCIYDIKQVENYLITVRFSSTNQRNLTPLEMYLAFPVCKQA
jgi:hypothetical protein